MTIRRLRWLTSLSLITCFGACGVSDLDVKGRDPGAGASAGSGASTAGGEGGDGTSGAASGGTQSSGGNVTSGGDDTGMGAEGGGTADAGADGGGTGGTPNGGTAGSSGSAGNGGSGGGVTTPACKTGALANVLFCDDFEQPGLPAWTHFANSGNDGASTRVTDPVHLGSGALRSIKSAEGMRDPLVADVLGNRTSGKLYVRVWMMIPSSVTIANNANASLLVLGEAPPSDGGVSVAHWATGVTLQVYDPNHNPTLVQAASYATTLPRDAWFCLRLDFPIGPNVVNTDFRLRIGNTAPVNSEPEKVVDSALSAAYNRLWVGVNYISPGQTTAVTAYYDDIAVDTVDIPCQ